MLAFVQLLGTLVANLFRLQRLEVENLFLRHQLNIVIPPTGDDGRSAIRANDLLGRSTLSLTEADRRTRSPQMLSCVVPFSRKRSPACFAQLL